MGFESHPSRSLPDAETNRTQFEAAMQFVVGALMGLLLWWLDNDVSYSAD